MKNSKNSGKTALLTSFFLLLTTLFVAGCVVDVDDNDGQPNTIINTDDNPDRVIINNDRPDVIINNDNDPDRVTNTRIIERETIIVNNS